MLARVSLLLEPQPEGGFTVTCPSLPEFLTEGRTVEEAMAHVEDAFAATVELYRDMGRTLPDGILVEEGVEPLTADIVVSLP
ncbi:MAG: type II toxin-antitoxin system HicB family antitoxin [Chloroflexi bacterium]|nr:type II toxin-antitoxin system HicB family antitoxin [Chloroflexota bacterium]